MSKGLVLADQLFSEFGLHDYVGCVTAEMYERPIPFVFQAKETQALTSLYEKWLPAITRRLIRELEPPVQPINKKSRIGYYRFDNPPNKNDVLKEAFEQIDREGISAYEDAFIIINVRLQAEPTTKTREMLFLTSQGAVELRTIDAHNRTVRVKQFGLRISSRVRLIFNLPIPNLYKQVLDTATHNVLLKYPAFHHDRFSQGTLPVRGYHVCFDVKSFERFTAEAVRARSRFLGGLYSEIGSLFERIPFAVSVEKEAYFIKPARDKGWVDQFASGDSAVAPVQKEIFTALYASFVKEEFGLNDDAAIQFVWTGGNERLTIRNYGDDNSISGDKQVVLAVLQHMNRYLQAEPEDPPKFLGFVWNSTLERWELPVSSYLLKTWLNERRPYSRFRRFPNLGWHLKREVFRRYGTAQIKEEVFGREDQLLEQAGLPWTRVLERAGQEQESATALRLAETPSQALGREYEMSTEMKIKSGEFFGIGVDRTLPMLKKLIGPELQKLNHILT
jgi:hypothetical protein